MTGFVTRMDKDNSYLSYNIGLPPCVYSRTIDQVSESRFMLTKILFTVIVIVIVLLVYQARFKPVARTVQKIKPGDSTFVKPPKWVIYTVVCVLASASGVVYFFKWQADNSIITIHVVSVEQEDPAIYKALQKNIKGRTFTTLDGRLVTLGDSDRIEILGE